MEGKNWVWNLAHLVHLLRTAILNGQSIDSSTKINCKISRTVWLTKTWFEKPDVGVAASKFDHAEFFALTWAAVESAPKIEGDY